IQRLGEEMRAVEQHGAGQLAASGGAIARDDGIVAATDRLHKDSTVVLSSTDGGNGQGPVDQEVRGRDSGAQLRAEARAAEGNQAGARARRSARKRRVRRGQGAT